MATIAELKFEIEQDKKEKSIYLQKANDINLNIDNKIKLLEQLEKEDIENQKKELLLKAYGTNETNSNIFIVFNKQAKFIKVVDVRKEFNNFSDFEQWLKSEKIYAHCFSSFGYRSFEWYKMTLAEQLKNLEWEFDNNGNLKNTNW